MPLGLKPAVLRLHPSVLLLPLLSPLLLPLVLLLWDLPVPVDVLLLLPGQIALVAAAAAAVGVLRPEAVRHMAVQHNQVALHSQVVQHQENLAVQVHLAYQEALHHMAVLHLGAVQHLGMVVLHVVAVHHMGMRQVAVLHVVALRQGDLADKAVQQHRGMAVHLDDLAGDADLAVCRVVLPVVVLLLLLLLTVLACVLLLVGRVQLLEPLMQG